MTDGFKDTGGCGWCDAFVTDYNAEALLFGAPSSNRLEQMESYVDLVQVRVRFRVRVLGVSVRNRVRIG